MCDIKQRTSCNTLSTDREKQLEKFDKTNKFTIYNLLY